MIQIVVINEKGCFHPIGHPHGLAAPDIESLFGKLPEVLALLGPKNTKNVFYTLGHHAPIGGVKPSRTAATFDRQPVIAFDIDDKPDHRRAEAYLKIVAGVLRVPPEKLILINSGNGLHVLAHLKTPIQSASRMRELKPAYNELCRKIQAQMLAEELPGKVDPVVWEAARVLRLPGTTNSKPDPLNPGTVVDKACALLQNSTDQHDLDLDALAGLDQLAKENIAPGEIRRTYPLPDFSEIARECRFVSWAIAKPEELHEPQVFDLFSLLAVQAPGKKITLGDKEYNSRELGEYIWDHATASKSLARQNFEAKWADASRYGARKCSTVGSNTIGICESCPHRGRIPTPLALKSSGHIASSELGYWVLGKNGNHLYPHYADLVKIYHTEKPYISTQDERLFTFEGTHYSESAPLLVKNWLERKVTPSDPLVIHHRSEFYQKVMVAGVATKATEKELFVNSIRGKLNCRNGILDILKGELHPHSHTHGFQYCLPYDYHDGQSSEFFMDWLSKVMLDRVELMEAVLDIMAYCLWPAYDSHVFTYLTGEGANGKGTLLAVLQALVGRENASSISLAQLAQNRFAPAELEGKLVNLVGESSGAKMTFEEMNVIKDLSAGGTVFVERKGQQGFWLENRTKLIFSANKTPLFADQGHAIKRRLLAIPFDYTFKVEDSRVQTRLLEEVPAICSMLVRRIQENIKQHGRFIVSRGGDAAKKNQEKILQAGNSVVEWADEHLESSIDLGEDAFVSTVDAYASYTRWCTLNNFKVFNKNQFGFFIARCALTPAADGTTTVKRIGGKQVRGFAFTRWKEEAL